METGMLRIVRCVTAVAVVLASASNSRSDDYPTKPINIVVALAAGGVADVIARAIGQRLTEEWGQPVIVENKGAANTQVGAAYVAKSAPDGYTLLLTPEYTFTANPFLYRKSPYDPAQAFTPVSGLATVPLALVVSPKLAAKNVKELIELAKAEPGKLNYGIPGVGSTSHLSTELLQAKAGVKLNPVSYKGAAPALTDIVAGHIQAMFVSVGLVNEPAKVGQLRILGVGSSARLVQFPDLPTIADTLPEFEATIWFGLFAPSGTPPDIVAKLNGAVQRILADPAFEQKYITANSYQRMAGPPASLSAIIAKDSARWGKVIRDAGIAIDD
jgi:tripartite-type tricarboxylate transporter receptor subunit TctC